MKTNNKSHSLSLLLRFIGYLLLASFGCLLVNVVIVALLGADRGIAFIDQLLMDSHNALLHLASSNTIARLDRWLALMPTPITTTNVSWMGLLPMTLQQSVTHIWLQLIPFINALLLGGQLVLVRGIGLLIVSPLFLLLGAVATIDGNRQRSIRRYQIAHESAARYHIDIQLIALGLFVACFVGITLPITWTISQWSLLTIALFLAVALQRRAKHFRQYQ